MSGPSWWRRLLGREESGEERAHPAAASFEEQSPYADRLTLAAAFSADDETAPTAQDRKKYDAVIWYDGFCSDRPLDH